jgi:hypothetical protein
MRLIPDWKEAWKWFSVQAFAVIIALPAVWLALPADVKAMVPDGWERWIVIAVAGAGLLGRVIDQKKAPPA